MTAAYARTNHQRQHDLAKAAEWEAAVAELLGPDIITRFDSTTDLDIWVPGYMVELKEKNQKYGARWHNRVPFPEQDLFIMDELTVRRGLGHWPYVFYLVRDNPGGGRLVWMPIWELISVERVRVNRVGKGKWLIDMSRFRTLESEAEIPDVARHDLASTPWKKSEVLSAAEIPQA